MQACDAKRKNGIGDRQKGQESVKQGRRHHEHDPSAYEAAKPVVRVIRVEK